MEAINKEEVREQLDDIENLVEIFFHPDVSPDNFYIYSRLHDEIERLEILLKQNYLI